METLSEKVPIEPKRPTRNMRAWWLVALVTVLGIVLGVGLSRCRTPTPKHIPARVIDKGNHFLIVLENFSLQVPADIGNIAFRNEVGSPLAKQNVRLDGEWGRLLLRYYPLQRERDVEEWHRNMKRNLSVAAERMLNYGGYPAIEIRSVPSGEFQEVVVLVQGEKGIVVVSGDVRVKDMDKRLKILESLKIY